MFNFSNTKKGFSVLFASLIASLVLAIGLAILRITIKQITLASAGRESQHAFYAADTGTECALYLDYRFGGDDDTSDPDSCKSKGKFFGFVNFGEDGNLESNVTFCDDDDGTYEPNKYACRYDGSGTVIPFGVTTNPSLETYLYDPVISGEEVITKFGVTADDRDICYDVEVLKKPEIDIDGDYTGGYKTIVVSRGYSTCDKNNKNRFERAIKTTY